MSTQFLIVRAGGFRDGWLSTRALIEILPGASVTLELFLPSAAQSERKQFRILAGDKELAEHIERDSFKTIEDIRSNDSCNLVEITCAEPENAIAAEKRSLGIMLHRALSDHGEMQILFEPERNWQYFENQYASAKNGQPDRNFLIRRLLSPFESSKV